MIVGIGLHKTATSSLDKAFKILGYKSRHAFNDCIDNFYEEINKYDAISDSPVPMRFEEIDYKYKNSKFILTIRDLKYWHESMRVHFNIRFPVEKRPDLRKGRESVYGTAKYRKDIFERIYRGHIEYVKEYFINRSEDLLIMDIFNGDGWDKLCQFLSKPIPNIQFPYENKTPINWYKND